MAFGKIDEYNLQILNLDEDHASDNTEENSCPMRLKFSNVKRELQEIYRLAWPTVFTHLFVAALTTQSIFFCGHIGKAELAAGTLGISYFNIFGSSVAIGMCSALDTLCSQAYGASNFKMVGVVLQRGICVLGIGMIIVVAFWLTTEHFLLVIGIEEEISRMVDSFMMILLPALPPLFGSQLLIRYLGAQGIVRPTLWIGLTTNIIAIGLNFLIVILLKQGFWGVAISLVIVFYCNLCLTIAYIVFTKVYKKTWFGWSFECLYNWRQFVLLSLSGMVMICVEWWSFEIATFLISRFGENVLAANGVLLQIVTLTFMIPYGISAAATIRVGQNLGANKTSQAKLVMKLSIGLTWICISLTILVFVTTRKYIAMAFSSSGEVIEILTKTIPILAVLCLFDATQGVCSGVVRGCGQQKIGVILNFISYDLVALPLGIILAFVIDLRLAGMWWGLSVGVLVQTTLYITLLSCTNWKKQTILALKRTSPSCSYAQVKNSKSTFSDRDQQVQHYSNDVGSDDDDERPDKEGLSKSTSDPVGFSKSSHFQDMDIIATTTPSLLDRTENFLEDRSFKVNSNQTMQDHTHSSKRMLCIRRLLPLVIAVLVLCGTFFVRLLVPLPTENFHHNSSNITVRNQTFLSNITSLGNELPSTADQNF